MINVKVCFMKNSNPDEGLSACFAKCNPIIPRTPGSIALKLPAPVPV